MESPTSTLGPYELLSKLGQGGMGVVFEARGADGRRVALKVLRPEGESRNPDELRARFLREAQIARRLTHPRIVAAYDSGEADGCLFLACELVAGGSLARLVAAQQVLPPRDALRIVGELCEALSALDAEELVHRDIKPHNLLITADGHIKLSDLGLARSVAEDGTILTLNGRAIGTPSYMSPEQIEGDDELDIRCDLYAAGVVLYELLTGAPPFREKTVIDTYSRTLNDPPAPLPAAIRDALPGLEPLLLQLLAKDRADRPASPEATLEAIAEVLGAPLGSAPIPVLLERARALSEDEATLVETLLPASELLRALPAARLTTRDKGRVQSLFVFAGSRLRFGRKRPEPEGPDVTLRLRPTKGFERESRRISGRHFELSVSSGSAWICDLGSTCGTAISDARLSPNAPKLLARREVLDIAGVLECIAETISDEDSDRDPAILLTRPFNGEDHAYALIPRRLCLEIDGGALRPFINGGLELRVLDGRLVMARRDGVGLEPLTEGARFTLDGVEVEVEPVTDEGFLTEPAEDTAFP